MANIDILKDKKHLISIIIIVIMMIGAYILIKKNENFIITTPLSILAPTTTRAPTTTSAPTTTNYLVNALQNSYDKINIPRFTSLDNQDRLNEIEKRMQKIKKDLAITNTSSNINAPNTLTFY